MADMSREELLQALADMDAADGATVEFRGREVRVDEAAKRSWPVVTAIARFDQMDGLHATVELMNVVCAVTDLTQEDVLDMSGGPMADFGDVASTLADLVTVVFPKA